MKSFDIVSDGKKVLKVSYRGEQYEFALSPVDFQSSNIEKPVVDRFKAKEFTVVAEIYADRIDILTDTEDIEFSIEDAKEIETSQNFLLYYVPVIKYTQESQEVIEEIFKNKHPDKTIIPLIDIRTKTNLQHYLSNHIEATHFLDLCELRYIVNEEEKEKIKLQRREFKKRYGTLQGAPEIPENEYEHHTMDEILANYANLKNDFDFIPICRIDTSSSADMQYAKYIRHLFDVFGRVALRTISLDNLMNNFESYLLPLVQNLSNVYVILECNAKNGGDKAIVRHIKNISDEMTLVYIRETIDYDYTKILVNKENIFANESLKIYQDLYEEYPDIWYGDYLGFDRNTAIEFIPGMKPNASAYLLKIESAQTLCILKIKDDKELGTAKTKHSMQLLQQKWLPDLIPTFIDPTHCKGCERLLNEPLNLAKAKQFCQMHNGTILGNI